MAKVKLTTSIVLANVSYTYVILYILCKIWVLRAYPEKKQEFIDIKCYFVYKRPFNIQIYVKIFDHSTFKYINDHSTFNIQHLCMSIIYTSYLLHFRFENLRQLILMDNCIFFVNMLLNTFLSKIIKFKFFQCFVYLFWITFRPKLEFLTFGFGFGALQFKISYTFIENTSNLTKFVRARFSMLIIVTTTVLQILTPYMYSTRT